MNLTTAYEVLRYSTAGKDYPTGQFCELIPQIEEEFARDCLGQELYDHMVDSLAEYPTGAAEFDTCTAYAEGDTVIRNGCLFVSQIDDNVSDPLNETGDWAAFERFTEAGANLLWTKYLRRILALKVFVASRYDTTWRAGAGGVSVATGDSAGFRAASKTELTTLTASDVSKIETATKNMLEWLRLNAEANGLPTAPACSTNSCQTRGSRVRRWNFGNQPAMTYGHY